MKLSAAARRGGGDDVDPRRVRQAVGDVVGDAGAENERILRHQREFMPQRLRIDLGDIDPVERDDAPGRIVEPLQQLENGRLAGARGTDERDHLTRHDAKAHALEHVLLGPRGVGEADVREGDLAARRARQRQRMGGRDDPRAGREEFADPRRRAGGLADLVPNLRYLAERTRAEHREQQELRQRAGGHAVVDDALRAEPEHQRRRWKRRGTAPPP